MATENVKSKKCFIITPIGADDSFVRRSADGVIDAAIIPELIELGIKEEDICVAHRMPNPGSINSQVITRIYEDDLVIANLTGLNANVMYELAVRHATRKPTVQICDKDTELPFDIKDERTIYYVNDIAGVMELRSKFKKMTEEALKEAKPDNPIYRAIKDKIILQEIDKDPKSRNIEKYLIDRLNSMEKYLGDINRNINSGMNISYDPRTEELFMFRIKIQLLETKQQDTIEELIKSIILKINTHKYQYVRRYTWDRTPENKKVVVVKISIATEDTIETSYIINQIFLEDEVKGYKFIEISH